MISKEYKDLNAQLHKNPNVSYGYKGWQQADAVIDYAREFSVESILDYGAGKQTLSSELMRRGWTNIQDYDPAIAGIDIEPRQADMVVCSDVMEHVEPMFLLDVIRHLKALTRKVLFLRICTIPCTSKTLPDGSSPHRSLMSKAQWWQMFSPYFDLTCEEIDCDGYFTIILKPKINETNNRNGDAHRL